MSQLTVFGENAAHGPARAHGLQARPLRTMIRMMAVPKDRHAWCRIAVSETSGWDVRVDIDGRTVALMHRTDWHHVERLCSTLARTWAASHTELPASR